MYERNNIGRSSGDHNARYRKIKVKVRSINHSMAGCSHVTEESFMTQARRHLVELTAGQNIRFGCRNKYNGWSNVTVAATHCAT